MKKVVTLDDFGYQNPMRNGGTYLYAPTKFLGVKKKMTEQNKTNKKPIKQYKKGTIQLSKWENEVKDGSFFTYSLSISYFDEKTKEYKDSKSMTLGQLSILRGIIDKAIHDEIQSS